MGVTKLWEVLENAKTEVKLEEIKGLTIAVDLAPWICDSEAVKPLKHGVAPPYLRNLFFRVSSLLKAGINPVFVLDGKAPQLKLETISKRLGSSSASSKKSSSGVRCRLNAKMKECCVLLDSLGVPWVKAESEAEALCAALNKAGLVDAVMTNDSDAFLYGAQTVYRRFSVEKNADIEKYTIEDVENVLGFNQKDLLSLGLLLGCDYCPKGVVGVGVAQAVKLIKSFGKTDALSVFLAWKNTGQIWNAYDNVTKQPHCSTCGHEGARKDHCKTGCWTCGDDCAATAAGIKKPSRIVCQCRWHNGEEYRKICALEEKIKSLALENPTFPDQDIIDEFLRPQKYLAPSTAEGFEYSAIEIFERSATLKESFKIRPPILDTVCNYLEDKFKWSVGYALDKVVPLLTHHILSNPDVPSQQASIDCIVKARVKDRIPSLEVKWALAGSDRVQQSHTTVESEQDVKRVFPDAVAEFHKRIEVEKEEKKKARAEERRTQRKLKASSSKAAAQSMKMTDYFKASKSRGKDQTSISKSVSRGSMEHCLSQGKKADAKDLKSTKNPLTVVSDSNVAKNLDSMWPLVASNCCKVVTPHDPIIIFGSDSGDSDSDVDSITNKFDDVNLSGSGRPGEMERYSRSLLVKGCAGPKGRDLTCAEITFGNELDFSLGCSLLHSPSTVLEKENRNSCNGDAHKFAGVAGSTGAKLSAAASQEGTDRSCSVKLPLTLNSAAMNSMPDALKRHNTPEKSMRDVDVAESPPFMTLMERLEGRKKGGKG